MRHVHSSWSRGKAKSRILLVDKIDFRALISRRRKIHKTQPNRTRRAGTRHEGPGPLPVIPTRSKVFPTCFDHENPGSKEPAERSEFLNLSVCANLIDHGSKTEVYVYRHDPKDPGSKEPAEVSCFRNLEMAHRLGPRMGPAIERRLGRGSR